MAQTLLRDKTRGLRSKGTSLNEITRRLKIPKSTVRYWCRDIVLSSFQQKRLFEKQKLGGIHAAEKIRQKRLRLINQLAQEGISEVGNISQRELLLIGAALYWAEGYRKGDGEFGFTNSDPRMIKFILCWLHHACGIKKDKIHLRICINAVHQKRLEKIKKFWTGTTKVPINQFSKPTIINAINKKLYLNPESYFGTLRVKVRQSTNLRRKVMGWIEGIAKQAL